MSIRYKSTRGQRSLSFEEVVLSGLANDKGLYVPEIIPNVSKSQLAQMRKLSFPELAYEIISMYVKTDEVPSTDLREIVIRSFETFRTTEVTPCVKLSEFWMLELFHGPTFAFKDVALQFLGNLFEFFLTRGKYQKRITILGATSGDTGSAAIHGLRGKRNVNCYIMFPHGKVTEIQERQMTTVTDSNVHCISVRGDFDDAQAIVKGAFADRKFREEVKLGAINSINWARVLAQITYYFYSWFRVTDGVDAGEVVDFCVPTGNFGDILAGYYAKQMGLPIGRLVVCTNQNDVLHRFFQTGVYKKSPAILTIAPSMDISVSSNFERYLFYLAEESTNELRRWMDRFETTEEMWIDQNLLHRARNDFISNAATKSEIIEAMKSLYLEEKYLVCPHTATAVVAARKLKLSPRNTVVLATAHPAKFEEALALALPLERIPCRPLQLGELFSLPTRKVLLPTLLSEVQSFIRKSNCSVDTNTSEDSSSTSSNAYFLIAGTFAAVLSGYLLHKFLK